MVINILSNRSEWTFYFSKVFNLILQSTLSILDKKNLFTNCEVVLSELKVIREHLLIKKFNGTLTSPENFMLNTIDDLINELNFFRKKQIISFILFYNLLSKLKELGNMLVGANLMCFKLCFR